MRRYGQLAATAAGALLIGASVVAAAPTARPTAEATVTAVSVVPGAGRADVVLRVDGSMDFSTFTLEGPHRIVVDLRGAKMQLRAPRYDRVARAGIRNVRIGQFSADVVRLVLDLDNPREYEVIRGEGEIRVRVRGSDDFAPWSSGAAAARATPVAPAATPAVEPRFEAVPERSANQQRAATQQRITVRFFNRSIHEVISQFADFSGRNFVTAASVTGTVNAEIVNQPWDVALDKILQQSGLQAVEDSTGIITIDSYANIAQRVAAEPLVTQLVVVNYAKASELAVTIRALIASCSSGSAALGSGGAATDASGDSAEPAAAAPIAPVTTCGRGVVAVEDQTNTMLVTETVSRLPEIISYIRDLDKRTPQVAIKAKIIAVDRTATEEMGLSYDIGSNNNYNNTLISRGTPGEFQVDLGGNAFIGVANANRIYRGSSALSLIFNTVIGGNNLTAFLDALSSEQLSDVQAEPSTTTIDNREASLFAGTEIAYLLTPPITPGQIQAVAPQIQRQRIGITLTVTPHVTANRQISLNIFASQQSLISVTIAGPEISERTATNEVLVGDGETAVIAGLTQTQVTRVTSGIPFLMKLPLIGRIFSETRKIERKQDLLILITPHIVDEGEVVRTTTPP